MCPKPEDAHPCSHTLIRLLLQELSHQGLHSLLRPNCLIFGNLWYVKIIIKSPHIWSSVTAQTQSKSSISYQHKSSTLHTLGIHLDTFLVFTFSDYKYIQTKTYFMLDIWQHEANQHFTGTTSTLPLI